MADSQGLHILCYRAPSGVAPDLLHNSPVTSRSSSMSGTPRYDVFLSFRGKDTRNNFAKFLRAMLRNAQIHAFIDEEDLPIGEDVINNLTECVKKSDISIPIISKDYASSYSCLIELTQMLKCKDEHNRIIIPIFYYVNPSDVRRCEGPFKTSLLGCKHGRNISWKSAFKRIALMGTFTMLLLGRKDGRNHSHIDSCKSSLKQIAIISMFATSLLGLKDGRNHSHIDDTFIGSCKSALERIADLSGHHLHKMNEGEHIKIIDRIIHEIRQKLKKEELIVPKQLVGVKRHEQSIMEKLKVDNGGGQAVRIDEKPTKVLVISGTMGVGKTVLARYIYNRLCHLYSHCSFCGQIQEKIKHHKVLSMQNKLISGLQQGNTIKFDCPERALTHLQNKFQETKALLLLDDVKDYEQLSALVGKLDWLGPGSKVIVTTQSPDVLSNVNGAESFVLGPMEQSEALKLFCWHAFGTDSPSEKFKELSIQIVEAADRLPLVLELVGSSLFLVKKERQWKETLTALKKSPHEKVQAALEKSYATNLNENEREIFLDIAYFFIGKDMRIPYYMWDDCNFCPSKSIRALEIWSFIKIGEDKELCMNEKLKNFGRETVKCPRKPWERSRLCDHEEALRVLTERKGTGRVKALTLKFGDESKGCSSFDNNQFKGLQNLRFLKLDRADIRGNFQNCFSSLRWLDWQGAPKSFDVQLQNLPKLVILDLSGSEVDKDWRGWDLLKEARKLKVLKLTNCEHLIDTPIFPPSMELERLTLEGSFKLSVINQSSGYLEKLVYLNLKQCEDLSILPNLGPMTGLEELVIDGTSISQIKFQAGSLKMLKNLSARDCTKLTEVSDSFKYLESLKHLALDRTKIQSQWESIGSLQKLKTLSLRRCEGLIDLPEEIGKLRSLKFLDLSHTMIRELPPIEGWKAMKVLRMERTYIEEFPEAIPNLDKLEEIDFSNCRSLKGSIREPDISRLSSLAILKLPHTQISRLPSRLHLRELDIFDCKKLQGLPELPPTCVLRR